MPIPSTLRTSKMSEESQDIEVDKRRVVLVVSKQHVKSVKTALEQHGKLDRTTRIVPETDSQGHALPQGNFRIPTTIPYRIIMDSDDEELYDLNESTDLASLKFDVLENLGLRNLWQDISLSHHTPTTETPAQRNPLRKAIHEGLDVLPESTLSTLNLTRTSLADSFPLGYSIYPPLLLLPHNAFSSPSWKALLSVHPATSPTLAPLWIHLASAMGVSHIAINSPIPLTSQPSTSNADASSANENILRSPSNIQPLHGPFGPSPTPQTLSCPTPEDFSAALWVSTIQNGIYQTWAPMYTMFSRGNIREKTRILQLPSTTPASAAEAVVDMYAGIGYFALSYRKRGVRPVVCFELNPWSIEGLRRGILGNNWTYHLINPLNPTDLSRDVGDVDFIISPTSNIHATSLIPRLESLSPIRHVNLGLLPRSRDSWHDAVELIDRKVGGWIRAHENVGEQEMEERKDEVERVFQRYVDECDEGLGRRKASVRHVERVKMYAPGVVHCVFDVWIDGEDIRGVEQV
jgi:tRNA wybutosine-synthesizing protein 2